MSAAGPQGAGPASGPATPAPPSGRDGPHAFLAGLTDAGDAGEGSGDIDRPELDDRDRHHLERVLRLRPGDTFTVSDGAGRWRTCRFGPTIDPAGPVVVVPPSVPLLTVAFAVTKADKPELVVQKLTEVGVDVIVPFVGARSVVRWDDDRARRNVERLRRIAREASMQCRRVRLPQVADLTSFAVAAALAGACMADREGDPPSLDRPTVLVGPEGGWSREEAAEGLPRIALGPLLFRSETAAVAAGVVLGALRAGLVLPA